MAHVQEQNVALFQRLHWRDLGELCLHGRAHRLMQAELCAYPLRTAGEIALYPGLRRAA